MDDIDRFMKDLKAWDSRVSWSAAETLGRIGDARAVLPLIEALKDGEWNVRGRAAEALGQIGDARAIQPLTQALKDKESYVRWRAAEALGQIGDARAVAMLEEALKDAVWAVRREAAKALEKIKKQRRTAKQKQDYIKKKRASILCSACFCRFTEHHAKMGFLRSFSSYFCPNCHGYSFIASVNRVVAVLDHSLDQPHDHRETTLLVSWFAYRQPFDFDEIRIVDANDFDVDELVMKLRNDMDDKRRKRYKSMTVFVSHNLQLSPAKIHMLKDTFGRVERTD